MKKPAAIVAIGDSLTYGYPYPPDYSWVRIAADHLGMNIINKGVCGETTGDMRRRFGADVTALDPGCVIITGGSNDAFLGVTAAAVAKNIAAMVGEAQVRGIKAIIGLPPPCDFAEEELLAEYRERLREVAAHHGLPSLDFHAALVAPDGGLQPGLHIDGVHPNEDGYALMAAKAIETLAGLFAGDCELR